MSTVDVKKTLTRRWQNVHLEVEASVLSLSVVAVDEQMSTPVSSVTLTQNVTSFIHSLVS